MDYETFANAGLGLGDWKPTIIVIFWVTVMILIVISQNIVLSIVVNAYHDVSPHLLNEVFECLLPGVRCLILGSHLLIPHTFAHTFDYTVVVLSPGNVNRAPRGGLGPESCPA
jgi:hypothetical protein